MLSTLRSLHRVAARSMHVRICFGAAFMTLVALGVSDAGGTSSRPVIVIVALDEEPVATYRGAVAGLAATSRALTGDRKLDPRSAAVVDYRAHLARRFADHEARIASAIPGTRVLHRYDVVLGGLAVQVPEDQVDVLATLPGVRAVYRDEPSAAIAASGPAFIDAPALWSKLGGPENGGEDIVIGVIDTGIWPEHPSFADPDPKGKGYTAPASTLPCQFSAGPNPGPLFACNGKLIGAYRFLTTWDACVANGFCTPVAAEFSSARDSLGHGTFVASVAAGNGKVPATILGVPRGSVSGVAPRAHIIAYKVIAAAAGFAEGFSFGSDEVAAIQQAVLDGVDVINFSIAQFGADPPYLTPVELAFRDAYAAGVFVAAGAANSGPAPDTIRNEAPWVTTVAASTPKSAFEGTVTLRAGAKKLKLTGASITGALKPALSVVLAASVGDEACDSATPDGAFTDKIVVCKGTFTVSDSFAVRQRGAADLLLYAEASNPFQNVGDTPRIPTVQLDAVAGTALLAFLNAHTDVTATFAKPAAKHVQSDVIAAFSSRGGPNLAYGVGKPDIAAPGVQIIGGETPQPSDPIALHGELFDVSQGTSFATPQIAGAAALVKQLHPTWSPGEIKSALMTTANAKRLVKEDGATPFDAFDGGSGRVDLKKTGDPGITFDVPAADFVDHAGDLWMVNYPSLFLPVNSPNAVDVGRTARSQLAKATTWALAVAAPPDLRVTVQSMLPVPAGGEQSFTIHVDKSAVPPGAVRFATLELTSAGHVARFPITAVGSEPLSDLVVTAASASSPVTIGGPVTISVTVQNVGAVAAGPFSVFFFVAPDAVMSPDAKRFALISFTGLAAGASSAGGGTLEFDPDKPVPPGDYHVLAVADLFGQVTESDETNNVLAASGMMTVQ